MTELVLASSSPYRAELLKKLHLDFVTHATEADETARPGESARALAQRLAKAKATAAAPHFPNHLIIGSDQVATLGTTLLGKPGSRERAIQQLTEQSGQRVSFYTGICVLQSASGRFLVDSDHCEVHFRSLDRTQIERYVDIEKPFDCAGSFKSEGYGIVLFEKILTEDPNALIGLPLIKLVGLLAQFGIDLP